MARGQDGSLLLSCMTLSFTTSRRFIPTLSTQECVRHNTSAILRPIRRSDILICTMGTCVALVTFFVCRAAAADNAEGVEFFEKKIRPVLAERCYSCHSAGAKALMGGLMLDSAPAMKLGGNSGKPATELLVAAIRRE